MATVNKATRIPRLNTLQFIPANATLPIGYNTWPLDQGFFYQHIRTFFQTKVRYSQKVATSDMITIYLDSLAQPDNGITIQIIDENGNIVSTVEPIYDTLIAGNVDSFFGDPYVTYTAQFSFSGTYLTGGAALPDGFYYVVITTNYGVADLEPTVGTIFVSEQIQVRAAGWPKTILLEYSNTTNAYDIFYNSGITPAPFAFRVEGDVDIDPAFTTTQFEDMFYTVVKLLDIPYRVADFTIGGNSGVPIWVYDKVNRILACDTFTIDGVQWFKDKNAQWSTKKINDYAMKAATIKLRNNPQVSEWEYNNSSDPSTFKSHTDGYSDAYS